jgi:replicative DNA helicase
MPKPPDDADRAKAGTLPRDPSAGTERVHTYPRVVRPGEQRTPDEPCDIASEQALLGALLWAGENSPVTLRVSSVLDVLESGVPFYVKAHVHVYDAIRACHAEKVEHAPVAVFAKLVAAGHDRSVGGLDAVRRLQSEASSLHEAQAQFYAHRVRDTWARREVIREARALIEEARSPKTAAEGLMAKALGVAATYAERSASTSATVTLRESATAFWRDLEAVTTPALSTGFRDLDDAMNGGVREGETSILAARTSIGKSLLAAQIAENLVTADPRVGALYATLEMKHTRFTARLVAMRSGVPLGAIRRKALNATQWSEMNAAIAAMVHKGLYFCDSPVQTLASIYSAGRQRARILARDGRRLGLIVVDYLGLVKPSAELLKKSSREQQVAETSRGLRFIAAELGCHVMGLVQISRESEKQPSQSIPRMHMIRDSGSIENDADTVLILHREKDPSTGMFKKDTPAALIMAKGRDDGTRPMLLDYSRGCFSDWNDSEQGFSAFYGRATSW